MSFLTEDLSLGFWGIALAIFFLILFYKKILQIKSLKKELKKEREIFIKTLNHDLKVATLAQHQALELLGRSEGNNIEIIKEAQKSCLYSLDMINMLIKTYQINDTRKIYYQRFSLLDLINECIRDLNQNFKEKNIGLYFKTEEHCMINADEILLAKLFQILFSVAIFNGDKNKSINVIIKKENQDYVIIIAYQGKLLSKDECEKIFTEKSCLTTVGFGIKMYLCKKIVEIHGGTIQALTYDKNVNMFTFKLPINIKEKSAKIIDSYRLEHSGA